MYSKAIREKSWVKLLDKLEKKFVFLDDNDFIFEEDKKEEMFEELRIKLGKTKQELLNIIMTL